MCSADHVCNLHTQYCVRCGMGESQMVEDPSITCEQYAAGKRPVNLDAIAARAHEASKAQCVEDLSCTVTRTKQSRLEP